jgi:hypothetical protein
LAALTGTMTLSKTAPRAASRPRAAPGASTRADAGRASDVGTANQRHLANRVLGTARDVLLSTQVVLLASTPGTHLVLVRLEVLEFPEKAEPTMIAAKIVTTISGA